MNRRDILKYSAISVAAASLTACGNSSEPKPEATTSVGTKAPLPAAKGPRVVVVGGGWSGLAVAKYTKKFAPSADVVLVEKRSEFVSCPISNLYLVGAKDLDYLTHDYLQAARENNYAFFNATATGLDKANKVLHTSEGDIDFDHLVLAPGIDYDYSVWGVDAETEQTLRTKYPAGFIPGSEHMTIKTKLEDFEGGNFILTVPGGNYRCLPAPYERACLIAEYFKKNEIDGKVVLLDANPDITIKKEGFQSSFDEMYKDYIEYHPSSAITKIDLEKKVVTAGEMEDEYEFADAAFYPHVRGGKLLEVCGVAKDTAFNKMEGNIDPFTYEVIGEKNIYVAGDARPMGYSKSGNTANSEGHYLGSFIANRINKNTDLEWKSPLTVCYSAVSANPEHAISVRAEYKFEGKKLAGFTNVDLSQEWRGTTGINNGKALNEWAKGMFRDMFNA
ncbi:FAD-dependent oxidoreductase [Sulfurimonas sp.]|uniref:FAD-dependent oxidoreductase n=1 Tax=Sulfurimonas sp. TaxID=2022749 RepID=UPI00356A5913